MNTNKHGTKESIEDGCCCIECCYVRENSFNKKKKHKKQELKTMKPTVGRIVIYTEDTVAGPNMLPAVITFVHPDGSVNLHVLRSNERYISESDDKPGNKASVDQWAWPEREVL